MIKVFVYTLILQMPMLSAFVSKKEAIGTSHSVPNNPSIAQWEAMRKVCVEHFDPLRRHIGSPLYISSMYRSPALNKLVGGATRSDHLVLSDRDGDYRVAIDIDQDGRGKIGNRALFFLIKDRCTYVTLIYEFGTPNGGPAWVHWAISTNPKKNIKKVYRAVKIGNRTVYQVFSDINHI